MNPTHARTGFHWTLLFLLLLGFSAGSCQKSQQPEALEQSSQTRTIELTLDTPTPGWSAEVQSVHRVDSELWVIYRLTPPEGIVAQMISTTQAHCSVNAPEDLPVKHFVIGKTWSWKSNPEVQFVDSKSSLEEALAQSESLAFAQD